MRKRTAEILLLYVGAARTWGPLSSGPLCSNSRIEFSTTDGLRCMYRCVVIRRATRREVGFATCLPHVLADDVLRNRRAMFQAEHVSTPLGALDAHLALQHIHIAPSCRTSEPVITTSTPVGVRRMAFCHQGVR